MSSFRYIIAAAIMVSPMMMSPEVYAQSKPKLEGTYTDWTVYSRGQGRNKTCYALSKPKVQSPKSVNHGEVYFMVSNWKSGAAIEQPSFFAGYSLKASRAPEARVGSSKYTMYASANEAFIESSSRERALVSKMRAGATMTLKAVSSRGTNVSYQFSLKGITAALKRVKSACS